MSTDARREWLASRMLRLREGPDVLRNPRSASTVAEDLSLAADAAATIRELSLDGRLLHPLCVFDPDPDRRRAMAAIMARTEPVSEGLWALVTGTESTVRLNSTAIGLQATPEQDDFVRAYGISAVLGAPLLADGQLVGTVALVRFGTSRTFLESDEDLVAVCAPLLADLIVARRSP